MRIALIVGRKRGWTKTKAGLDEDEKTVKCTALENVKFSKKAVKA